MRWFSAMIGMTYRPLLELDVQDDSMTQLWCSHDGARVIGFAVFVFPQVCIVPRLLRCLRNSLGEAETESPVFFARVFWCLSLGAKHERILCFNWLSRRAPGYSESAAQESVHDPEDGDELEILRCWLWVSCGPLGLSFFFKGRLLFFLIPLLQVCCFCFNIVWWRLDYKNFKAYT